MTGTDFVCLVSFCCGMGIATVFHLLLSHWAWRKAMRSLRK